MEENYFLGFPLTYVWLPIVLGLFAGAIIPLRPFMRSLLHFTIRPNDKIKLERDTDALSKIIFGQNKGKDKDNLIGFCHTLRKIGLTLIIK